MHCHECKFYESEWYQGGECRFNPPVYIDGRSRWPTVNRGDWCGRFEAKNNTAVSVIVEQPTQE